MWNKKSVLLPMWLNMNKKNNRKAITLVEMLVVLAIMSIITLSLYTIFDTTTQSYRQGNASTSVFQNARIVLDLMSREMANALYSVTNAVYGMEFNGTTQVDFTCLLKAGVIYEVGYYWDNSDDTLYRRQAWPDQDVDEDDSANMSLLQGSNGTKTISANNSLYQPMAFGIRNVRFEYKTASDNVFSSGSEKFNYLAPPPRLPYAVQVILTAYSDIYSLGQPVVNDKEFRAIINIPGGGGN